MRAESGERADDKSEAIVRRIEQFNREYSSIVDYFNAKYPQQFKKVQSKPMILMSIKSIQIDETKNSVDHGFNYMFIGLFFVG